MQGFGAATMVSPILTITLWATALVLITRHGSPGQRWRQLATAGLAALLLDALGAAAWLGWLVAGQGLSQLAHPGMLLLVNLLTAVLRLTGYALLVAALLAGRTRREDQLTA
jgi:hypothetical protein